jgi:DNA-binding CsgD family transcriptional regulator
MSDLGLAPRFQALVGLTASERRVLFYLTEGWTAQEVADELVVSLTTIRSHIGSVLRKLGVKSQVAAVAIANSRDPWLLATAGAS